MNLSNLPARLGLQKWERVKLINSAYYAEDGDKVMITFWQTGEAICVDRINGETRLVADKLGGCPHSFISVGDCYYLTDTRAGRVLQYNASFEPIFEIDFTDCPFPSGNEADSPEWLQNTHQITSDLLATIDFRRRRVVVWSFQERIYSEYPVSDEWVLQSLKSIAPSSIAIFGIQNSEEQKKMLL